MNRSIPLRLSALLAGLLSVPMGAYAACSRPLSVPVAPSAMSVTIDGGQFDGAIRTDSRVEGLAAAMRPR